MKNARPIPILSGLLLGLLLAVITPFKFPSYKLEKLYTVNINEFSQANFADMDGDGNQDLIKCDGLLASSTSSRKRCHCCLAVGIRKDRSEYIIEQMNVKELPTSGQQSIVSNYDNNHTEDLLLPNIQNDSLFLMAFNINKGSPYASFFLDTFKPYKGTANLDVVAWPEHDYNQDGFLETTVSVLNSFPVYPRRVYRIDQHNGQVISSPSTCINILPVNGKEDYHLPYQGNFSPVYSNYRNHMPYPYPDTVGYVFALDAQLQFSVKPIPLPRSRGEIRTVYWRNYLWSAFEEKTLRDSVRLQSRHLPKGTLKHSWVINGSSPHFKVNEHHLLISTQRETVWLDTNFKISRRKSYPALKFRRFNVDINNDGKYEHFAYRHTSGMGVIITDDWEEETQFDVEQNDEFLILKREMADGSAQMVVKVASRLHFYNYENNPFEALMWPYYLGIFLISGGVSHAMFKTYRKNIEKRFDTERKVHMLQLQSLKNQVDPHFTLNALDSIDWMYRNNEVSKASRYLQKLTRLIHQTVLNSEKLDLTLFEELDFCRQYCNLEKERTPDFDFHIAMEESIDPFAVNIPRHLIYIQVENAIKHGLRAKQGAKQLNLSIYRNKASLKIDIADNGIGQKETKAAHSTGKGTKITRELIELYQQIHSEKITCQRSSDANGTTVYFVITRKNLAFSKRLTARSEWHQPD